MKKLSFLLLLCSFLFTSFAQSGSLQVSSSNNQRFWLFIDDILQNEYSVPSIKVLGMQFQQYKIRVEMDNPNSTSIGQTITITNKFNGDSYVVSHKGNGYTISQLQSNIKAVLVQNLIQPNYNYYNDYYHYSYPGFGNPENYWQGSGGNNGKPYQSSKHSNSGGHRNAPSVAPLSPSFNPGGGGHGNQRECRNNAEFSTAMSSLNRESSDAGKLQFAKNMTKSGTICVEQIIQICRAFSFESSKLEYAKFAYFYCSDKNLYYMVNNVFQFQSSKDELTKFIR